MKPKISTSTSSKPWVWQNRFWLTASVTIAAFLLYLVAYGFGFIPKALVYKPKQNTPAVTQQQNATSSKQTKQLDSAVDVPASELPKQVRIPSIGINTTVQNPASKRIEVLNRYLTESAVRYPGSGKPGNGNMFIFGHSSGLDSVVNRAYKTFNRLEDLSSGDTIYVTTESGTFTYAVASVEAKKDAAAYVPFDTEKDLLTIATCDNFGAKEDRIVVRAEYVDYVPE